MRPVPERRAVVVSAALSARRLAVAHWGLLAACALFLLVGALVLEDYGISTDEGTQREISMAALDYLAGKERAYDHLTSVEVNRYYGVAFEVPLLLVERLLGLDDSRDTFLSRHVLTHLFFLAGGVFCYLLVLRMFGNRLLALVAMVLFLLHPRLYAHSFFNPKDIPFAAMFMVALYLTHRAFRRETLGAFLLCGVGVGVLVNLRPLGLVLFVAVLALRGLDLLFAGGGTGERKRILLAGGAFALAVALMYYVALPGIWPDPIRGSIDALQVASTHPAPVYNLFRGEWLFGPDGAPFEYIPVWVGISTPPAVLLLAVIGASGLCWRGARRPRDIWRATPLRFNLLLLALVVVPIIAIFALQSNIYNGWRHVYFLYAPLALLAVVGFHWLQSCADRRWVRRGACVLAGVSVAVTLVSMVRIHPLEDSYYNSFVDRSTPDYLVSQYQTGMWLQLYWPLMQEIVEDHPEQNLFINSWDLNALLPLLPESKRRWVSRDWTILSTDATGFYSDHPVSERTYVSKIYNNTLAIFQGRQAGEPEVIVREALSGVPAIRDFFDIYLHDNMLVFIREACMREDVYTGIHRDEFHVHIFPQDIAVLSGKQKNLSRARLGSNLEHVVDGDGRCSWIVLLPDYPVYRFYARQNYADNLRWEMLVGIGSPVDPAVLAGEPLASGAFDIHRDGDTLIYVRDGCTEADEEAVFLAYFFPVDPEDLPDEVRRDGFDGPAALGDSFRLWDHGARTGDRCVTTFPLPDWPVANVRTGQYDESGWLWQMRFAVTPPEVDEAVLAGEPLARGAFDIHRDGDALVYVREGCTEDEAEARFLFHIYPINPGDLPAESQPHGFENRDFGLWDHGARIDGRCLAVVPLPAYPVDGVRVGQYDDDGDIWSVEFFLLRADAMWASLTGEPVASSVFDVYREDGALVYVREGCTEEDAEVGFLLHLVPVDVGDLPAARGEHGFDNRDFSFAPRGARMDGDCVVAIPLPDYPIASIRTGQYDETGELWSVEFTLPDGE